MSFWIKAPKGGTCCACKPIVCSPCTCPAPTLVCDSISASKTKCGFSEFGTASTPPKKYLVKTLTGSLVTNYYDASDNSCANSPYETETYSFSGNCTYSRPGCSLTEAGYLTCSGGTSYQCSIDNNLTGNCFLDLDSNDASESLTATTKTRTGTGNCISGGTFYSKTTGSAVESISSEYTTSLLISDAVAALPSYPGTYTGTCSSYYDLSSGELTYTVRRFKYKFTLPSMTGITSYVINWKEGATSKSYSWDGVSTETPVYGEVYEPSTNGTIGITDITVTCT